MHGPGSLPHPRAAGPVTRSGALGAGTSVYFRDPDGTPLALISYDRARP